MKKRILIITILLVVQIVAVKSQEIILKPGSQAPQLYIQEWIKGKPVQKFKSGKVYLVEFSGVGCTPCRNAIPHLSQLANKYRAQLEVISIYTLESNRDDVRDLRYVSNVKKFIKTMGDKISFSVATDVPQQYSFGKWVKASGKMGIPAMFLVDENNRLAWTGSIGELDEILDAKFVKNKSWDEIKEITDRNTGSKSIGAAIDSLFKQKERGEIKTAITSIDSLIALYPKKTKFYSFKFMILKGVDDDKAYECLQYILDQNPPNYDWFHLILESCEGFKKPNYAIAHEIADRAIQQGETDNIKAMALAQKAFIYNYQGDLQNAFDCSTKALQLAKKGATDPSGLKYFEDMLEHYKEMLQKQKSKG
jgi:thiol-disulfide isomerase/thioredoxin